MNKRREKVYIETTIPSYVVARPSRDIVLLGHQEISRQWWNTHRSNYDMHISIIVLDEVNKGDAEQARSRNALIAGLPVLDVNSNVEALALHYMRHFGFPKRASLDALHLALAVYHEMDFLLTWNCTHLSNANVRHRLSGINVGLGYKTPDICTPEELIPSR